MFDFSLGILRLLHEEHTEMLAVLERFETLMAKHRPGAPPDTTDPAVMRLLGDVGAALGIDISHHFDFEETHLFPPFADFGDPGITELLAQEHDILRGLGARLVPLITAARADGFTPETWAECRDLGGEVVEREVFHIQKESMGFLPGLEDILDPDDDGDLQQTYLTLKNT